ncbi:unnamed protein product [Fraxinus pennsylvanica]|uniref:DOG1 domain-containing protein n=1 Tax=Fraxinus pennsylvanica TaxID=56036 RepID=A0AAD1YRS7_9LAMI|nr:unnamed protein product [Fraxinus pennsylvanica]
MFNSLRIVGKAITTRAGEELKRARLQGVLIASGLSEDQSHSVTGNATDHDLRSAVNAYLGESGLRILLDGLMSHYDEIFRLKSIGSKSNIFHLLSGMWKTPVERRLGEALSSNTLGPSGSGNVANYMGQMAIAMGKLATLENFLHRADLLRQQTLQQMHRILTTRQAARALLSINDYKSRLQALSSLWLAGPKD